MEPLNFLSDEFQLFLGKESLTIKAPSSAAASELADCAAEQLAQAISNMGLKMARILWEGTQRPYRILAAMASSQEAPSPSPIVTPMVFGANFGFDAQDLRLLAQIQESEKPMSLVGLDGAEEDQQKWVNQALLEMLRRPREWATSLDLKTLWSASDLAALKIQLRQQSLVDLNNYRAFLPYAPGIFSATFEVVEFSLYPQVPKVPMRLVTTHSYEPLERTAPAWV